MQFRRGGDFAIVFKNGGERNIRNCMTPNALTSMRMCTSNLAVFHQINHPFFILGKDNPMGDAKSECERGKLQEL